MPINTDLNVAPYYDDFDATKKYYRVLFKPGYALQARELTQLQSTLQNQIEQFGDNIFKEGSIVKGCNFTELSTLSYVKVVDGITPTAYVDRTELATDNTTIEYYYELENASGLRAYIVAASVGYQSKAPDLNTFFINYLNTVDSTQQKVFASGEALSVKEYRIVKQTTVDPITQEETVTEAIQGGDVVKTTTVATFSNPTGKSYGLNVASGVIFQKGHFLFVEDQTIVLVKYMPTTTPTGEYRQPHDISIGFRVDEEIISSQQDTTLLDNANGSENENAPGADRLKLSPVLISVATTTASDDSTFFALRKYENGAATQIRDVSQYNVIGEEMARRTYEESGDYIVKPFKFDTVRKDDAVNVKVSPGVLYAKGYRVQNAANLFLPIQDITATTTQQDQPLSFEYGGYVDVINSHTATGVVDLVGYQTVDLLATDGTTVIGSAIVKNYTVAANRISTSTINQTKKGKLYIFGVRMQNTSTQFSDVRYVKLPSATGKLEITPIIRDANQSKLLFDLGQDYVKGISDIKLHTRKKSEITLSTGSSQATITPASGEVFTEDSLDHIVVIGQSNVRLVVTSPSVTEQGNLTFTVNQTGGTLTVYYDVRISPSTPRAKQSFDVYIKTTYVSSGANAKTRYTLGLPDAYKLLSVTSGTKDYTRSFKLVPNQKNNFYDHSYIQLIAGRPAPADGAALTIQVSVFKPDSSGVYNIFTVNSYAGIDPTYIPYFSGKSGTYNLRDCIDLRPHRVPLTGVTYETSSASAPTISSSVFVGLPAYTEEMFTSGDNYIFPALGTTNSSDIEYYLNRTDVVAVDSYGDFHLIKGTAATNSVAPAVRKKTPIAEVYVPGYPTYTHAEAKARDKISYGIKITPVGTKNYTMDDIRKVEEQVDRLTYYVSLSVLETATKNLLIRDADGNDRFKNGIIVDPFKNLSIADMRNPNFSASVDFNEKSLTPAVKTFPINLNVVDATNVQLHRDILATMSTSSSSTPVISQNFATNYRTATSNYYLHSGDGFLTPEYDGAYDTTTNPQNVSLDLTDAFDSLVDTIQEFYPLTSTSSKVSSSSTSSTSSSTVGNITTSTTTTDVTETIRETTKQIQSATEKNEVHVGDFVTDVRFNPYMRSRKVKIFMYGLRPNTRHYFFFGGVDVNAHVAPAVLKTSTLDTDNPFKSIGKSGPYGDAVKTNASGELYAVFYIPKETFFVGDIRMDIADVDAYDSIESASISKGFLTYRAYNFSVSKTDLTLSTRSPEYSVAKSTTTRTVTTRDVETDVSISSSEPHERPDRGPDPLAQTFFIKKGMSPVSGCIYISKVDLYFKRKSPLRGVTVTIREVSNGYPTREVVPLSRKHLRTGQVNVSEDASVATTFTFKSPIRLETEKEYALVVHPDASDPDYLLFTSKVGGTDIKTNAVVTHDAFDGTLFTSTNDRAWISYQDEDLKFKLYRYSFNTGDASLTMATDNVEFFTLSAWANTFRNHELVYTLKTGTASATFVKGSDVVSGTGIGSVYSVGDYIYVVNGSGVKDLLRVTAIAGDNNSVTVDEAAIFSGTFTTTAAVAGKVVRYNASRPDTLYLEDSSARTDNVFTVGAAITGLSSGATGTIGSIDNTELSFIRPSIERITDKATSIDISATVVNPALPTDTPYSKQMKFNDKTVFNRKGCVVYSKSNDPTSSKNLKIVLSMSTVDDTATPVVDIENAMLFASRYYINNESGDAAESAYISKTVSLAEGFDAEDFRLYVTGYRPSGSDIEAYIRLLNASDPQTIEDNPWIPLDMTEGVGLYSSTTKMNDFHEYVYEITETAGSNYGKTAGVVYYTNSTGKYSGYKNFQIRLVMKSSSVGSVPRMLDYRGIALE